MLCVKELKVPTAQAAGTFSFLKNAETMSAREIKRFRKSRKWQKMGINLQKTMSFGFGVKKKTEEELVFFLTNTPKFSCQFLLNNPENAVEFYVKILYNRAIKWGEIRSSRMAIRCPGNAPQVLHQT